MRFIVRVPKTDQTVERVPFIIDAHFFELHPVTGQVVFGKYPDSIFERMRPDELGEQIRELDASRIARIREKYKVDGTTWSHVATFPSGTTVESLDVTHPNERIFTEWEVVEFAREVFESTLPGKTSIEPNLPAFLQWCRERGMRS